MNWAMIWGLLRHLLTTGGGVLVADGYVTNDELTTVVGAIGIVGGVIWSLIQKKAS